MKKLSTDSTRACAEPLVTTRRPKIARYRFVRTLPTTWPCPRPLSRASTVASSRRSRPGSSIKFQNMRLHQQTTHSNNTDRKHKQEICWRRAAPTTLSSSGASQFTSARRLSSSPPLWLLPMTTHRPVGAAASEAPNKNVRQKQ